ncbi:hypothetical protein [uncultured Nocardioides sp.]|uniref:hypothetical protein n=1 Tax=uncultured Nocardioides sp. TaxID=198441 RepID=UPI002606678D|nr:hypothetical protein [uncultured Nocardioides sp.]
MTEPVPRTDEQAALIASAAAGDLSPADAAAYDALVAADPSVATETAELRALLVRVDDLGGWTEATPSDDLGARVLATSRPGQPVEHRPGPRRWVGLVAAAVALLALGGVGGAVLTEVVRDEPLEAAPVDPPEGPPGTLGAPEPIEFTGEPAEVDISADLVAHTWGTETVLGMTGWEPGASFRLVLLDADGDVAESGSFRGSEVTITCRMNGELLREDVDVVEIRDADGAVVARSDVPEVTRG